MANTRAQLSELFTPIYDEFMLMGFAEEKQVGPQIFTIKDDATKDWKFDGLSGTGEWELATELSSGGYQDLVLGYPKTITPLKYWAKILVSFEASDQEEYAMLKGKVTGAKQIGKGGNVKVERLMAAQIYGGFTTAGPDGQYLYDTDHPKNREETGITYDNLLLGPLSHDNLELAEKKISDNLYDMKGLPIPIAENPILLYPPALKGKAERLLSDRAEYIPEISAVNSEMAVNRFSGQYNPIMWRLLSAKEGGSDTAWYIIYKDAEALRGVYGRRPSFDNWIDKDIEAYVFKGSLMFASGPVFHNGLFASTGV
jgi:hypothetical protein